MSIGVVLLTGYPTVIGILILNTMTRALNRIVTGAGALGVAQHAAHAKEEEVKRGVSTVCRERGAYVSLVGSIPTE